MSATVILVIIAVTWVTIGVALAAVMSRHGYDAWGWLVVGAVLGPLAVPLAVVAARRSTSPLEGPSATLHSAARTDVLVGVDGSPESIAAVYGVSQLLGSRLGRLTVATAIPFDATSDARDEAIALLNHALALDPLRADKVVLEGVPAAALRDYAARGGYDAIAVGTTGRGLAKTLLGGVATALAHHTKVPVILFGSDR